MNVTGHLPWAGGIVVFVLLLAGLVLAGVVAWREHRRFVGAEENRRRNEALHSRRMGELARSETRLRLALDAITQGVIVADSSGAVLYRNPYAQPFTEARHGEALVEATVAELFAEAAGGRVAEREVELFGPPRRCLFICAMPLRFASALDGSDDQLSRQSGPELDQLNRQSGPELDQLNRQSGPELDNLNRQYGLVGQDFGLVALIDDVTEPRRLDAMRRDFVSNISHELRTPMGALSLLAETLIGETDPEVVSRLAVRVQTEATRLSDIVDDLLELSRIENNETSERYPVVIQQVVTEALSRVKPAADQKQMLLDVVLPSPDLVVRADRRQLTTAVSNLLDNAIKYSEAGSQVGVTTRINGDCVEVEVRDQGYGIPLNHQKRIFERFYQVDPARERTGGGIGLGLAIVRHVATNHGGEVKVESKVGEGSTFKLLVPISDGAPEPEADSHDLDLAAWSGSRSALAVGMQPDHRSAQPVGA